MLKQIFPIGLKYNLVRPNVTKAYEIVDVYKTYNNVGELIKIRYVSEYKICGQTTTDYDVIPTTIARSLSPDELKSFIGE